jgi:ArsR family transcriptional regulator
MKLTPPGADLGSLAQAFRALSNPNRLAMYLELLRFTETNVKSCALAELINRLDIGAPTVSHHTKELVSAGLIEVERDGKFIRCRLNETMRDRLAAFFQR